MATFNRLGLRAPLLYALAPMLKLLFASLVGASPAYYNGVNPLSKHTDEEFSDTEAGLIVYLSTAAALVLLGGAFAGLTIA
jgi:metal transporter CNNM